MQSGDWPGGTAGWLHGVPLRTRRSEAREAEAQRVADDDAAKKKAKSIAVTQDSTGQLLRLPALNEMTCVSKGPPPVHAVTLPNIQEALVQLHSKRLNGIL